MKGSALEKMARWLGTFKWNPRQHLIPTIIAGSMVAVMIMLVLVARQEAYYKQAVGEHLDNYADSNRAHASESVARIAPSKKFGCETDSRGIPIGYKMVTNGLEFTFIIPEQGEPFGFPDDTLKEAIEHAQRICAIRMEDTVRETLTWKMIN